MKCKNCGAISNGITCPVCGHKQLKRAECSVCFTYIFPGQEYCPKCGNPSIYRKMDNVKKITPDTIVHSEYSHNYNTSSESYNYKEDAYDYNEDKQKPNVITFASIFEPLKNSAKNKYRSQSYHNTRKTKKKRVVPIFLTIISIILVLVLSSFVVIIQNERLRDNISEFFTSDDEGNAYFNDFVFAENTTQSEYNHNVIDNGLAYVYNQQLYIASDDGITVYEPYAEPHVIIEDDECCYLYVNEKGVFYKNISGDYIVNNSHEMRILVNDVDTCYQLDDEIIYLDKNENLAIYNINTDLTTMLYNNVFNYAVDDVNKRIIVSSHNGETVLIDFTGHIIKDNMMTLSYGDHFVDGYLYFRDFDINYYKDIMSNEAITVLEDVDYYSFSITKNDDQILLYGKDNNDSLQVFCDEKGTFIDIHDDVEGFYANNNKVVFYTYDSSYNRIFYISDSDGNYTRLQ